MLIVIADPRVALVAPISTTCLIRNKKLYVILVLNDREYILLRQEHRTERRLQDVKMNDGLHFNVNALVPSYLCVLPPGLNENSLVQKQSRFRMPLDEHFAQMNASI